MSERSRRSPRKASPVKQLAAELVARQDAGQAGSTVFLGAGASVSSGIPTWAVLAEQICTRFHIEHPRKKAVDALTEYLNRPEIPYAQRYTIFEPLLRARVPSIGYRHLAQLVKDGLVSTIITTNWDPLVEQALFRVLPVEKVKILIRGEMPDDVIASVLSWRGDYPTVVKLHGDVQARQFMIGAGETRSFSEDLVAQLKKRVSGCTYLVGQSAQDVDVLGLLLGTQRDGLLYHVRYSDRKGSEIDRLLEHAQAQVIQGQQKSVLVEGMDVNVGDFDNFFAQLNLAVQLILTEQRRDRLRDAERSILDKERVGIGYINYTKITELVQLFTLEVKKLRPDLILFVNDPAAPGGMELQRRMTPIMQREKVNVPIGTIQIEGKSGSRTFKREVTSDLQSLPMDAVQTVLILDAITFSGNTLRLARDAIRAQFPHVAVRLGVLVLSQQLQEKQLRTQTDDPSEVIISQIITDRHEIFFPWGVTQTTSTFVRRFEGVFEEQSRGVEIAKRPWGTIEVLADEEVNSVRLLTIEAGRKLSFQRHLCRDELFVALDDNIGLEVCAEELSIDAGPYDEHVKSLILEKGDYVLVPRGVWHRTKASMDRVRLLEVSFGLYDQNNDIERRWDDYDRRNQDGTT